MLLAHFENEYLYRGALGECLSVVIPPSLLLLSIQLWCSADSVKGKVSGCCQVNPYWNLWQESGAEVLVDVVRRRAQPPAPWPGYCTLLSRVHNHAQRWQIPVMLMQGLFFFFSEFQSLYLKKQRQQAASVTLSSCQLACPSSLSSFLVSPAFPFKSERNLMSPCADTALFTFPLTCLWTSMFTPECCEPTGWCISCPPSAVTWRSPQRWKKKMEMANMTKLQRDD